MSFFINYFLKLKSDLLFTPLHRNKRIIKLSKCLGLICIAISLVLPTITFPANNFSNKLSIEFFASNNTHEIDLQTAFNRLQGKEQQDLKNETITVMHKNHVQQVDFENLLGAYTMSSDQKMTGDNSEKMTASFSQKLSLAKIFKLATSLANNLNQESVAVFIGDKNHIKEDVILKLQSRHYTIAETVKIIHDKLPTQYGAAFSLHLNNVSSKFDNAIVDEVEWLGRKIKSEEIQKCFPKEKIISHPGKAYLVFKNGYTQQL